MSNILPGSKPVVTPTKDDLVFITQDGKPRNAKLEKIEEVLLGNEDLGNEDSIKKNIKSNNEKTQKNATSIEDIKKIIGTEDLGNEGSLKKNIVDVTTQLNAFAKDYGWINLPLEDGAISVVTPRYRKIGKFVIIEGSIKGIDSLDTFKNIATLPTGYIPSTSVYTKAPIKNTSYSVNLAIGSGGNIALSCSSGAITSDSEITLNTIFVID